MDDLIGRQAAIEVIENELDIIDHVPQWVFGRLINRLRELPFEQRWISVSGRVPNSDNWVIITILDESGDTPYRYTDVGWYLAEARCWIVHDEMRYDVIAWMPLPEPYKGGEG